MMVEQKIKMSAKQPEGDRNGLNQPEVLSKLTSGFAKNQTHLAIVELVVVEQAQSEAGVLTNRVAFSRIELIDGVSADDARRLLSEAHEQRKPDQLDGFDDVDGDDVSGRGNE